jgi:hypothetical protein
MTDIAAFKKALVNHLTFYHECLIPKHPFFTGVSNYDDNAEFVVVSSPSRMGNHALMSILDSHPELPRVPGEDSFLRHSFYECSYNLNAYLQNLQGPQNSNYIRNLSSFPADTDKWAKLKVAYNTQKFPELHAGIQFPTNKLVVTDYQDVLVDINYDEYVRVLEEAKEQISATSSFSEVLIIYLSALSMLDPKGNNTKFLATYANSGLRRQCLWLCYNFPKVRILTSIRRFDSYAVSHIRSRYRVVEFKEEWITEAWEHWYHKIIDYFWIKANFPENIMLIPFEDISANTELVAREISKFLGINYHESMMTATVFGQPNKGNSSKRRDDIQKGRFYASSEFLPAALIPRSVYEIENALQYGMYS